MIDMRGLGLVAIAASLMPLKERNLRRNAFMSELYDNIADYPISSYEPELVQKVLFSEPRQLKGDESDLLGSHKKGKRAKRRMNHS